MDSDSVFAFMFGLFLVAIPISITVDGCVREQSTIEAIKAGLVQDADGHWVKETENETTAEKLPSVD